MIFSGDAKLALHTIKTAKWRSFLTMLGIIIGVASVIITVSLGEGVKQQVNSQIHQFGDDLITIRPGAAVGDSNKSSIMGVSLFNSVSAMLTDDDVSLVDKAEGVRVSAPLSIVSATASYDEREYSDGLVIGTTSDLPELINKEAQYGSFFSVGEEGRNVAVLGQSAAQKIFQENVPVGKSFELRGEEFIVRGVLEEFTANPIMPGGDYNNAIFIPYVTSRTLTGGNVQVFQIFAKPNNPDDIEATTSAIGASLKAAHGDQEDFTILTQDESVDQSSYALSLITAMITGVAAISLFVGGIGIMNIMLVSVTERTHEIGIRKAIGATNKQIMRQFMTEAIMLSIVGSIIGVILSLVANFFIRMFTDLRPAVNLYVAGLAVLVAIVVGIVFGVAPAYRAARKNPIDALRYQ